VCKSAAQARPLRRPDYPTRPTATDFPDVHPGKANWHKTVGILGYIDEIMTGRSFWTIQKSR
jgi:hypothetical protein